MNVCSWRVSTVPRTWWRCGSGCSRPSREGYRFWPLPFPRIWDLVFRLIESPRPWQAKTPRPKQDPSPSPSPIVQNITGKDFQNIIWNNWGKRNVVKRLAKTGKNTTEGVGIYFLVKLYTIYPCVKANSEAQISKQKVKKKTVFDDRPFLTNNFVTDVVCNKEVIYDMFSL